MSFYPEKITRRFAAPENAGEIETASARGRWASFVCGVSVEFSLLIDFDSKKITEAKFKTSGCGYVIAAADFLCGEILEKNLTALHGLEVFSAGIKAEFEAFPPDRRHCLEICFEALSKTLADYRLAQIEEWTGEKALICTCFGISEERIEREIEENALESVEAVGETCGAGTGCGSCQPLIQEILDALD